MLTRCVRSVYDTRDTHTMHPMNTPRKTALARTVTPGLHKHLQVLKRQQLACIGSMNFATLEVIGATDRLRKLGVSRDKDQALTKLCEEFLFNVSMLGGKR